MKSTSNFLPLEVLSLLSVDLFTILLIFVIASQSNQMPMGKYCLSLILATWKTIRALLRFPLFKSFFRCARGRLHPSTKIHRIIAAWIGIWQRLFSLSYFLSFSLGFALNPSFHSGRSLDFPQDNNSSTSFLVPVPGNWRAFWKSLQLFYSNFDIFLQAHLLVPKLKVMVEEKPIEL